MTLGPGLHRTPLPMGFSASGLNSGVRKYRPDLGALISDRDAVAVAVYTLNECKAAPILYCQSLLPSSKIRALITNSGQANAATGPEGLKTNLQMADSMAKALKVQSKQVLTASTGVIGQALAVDKICEAVPELIARAGESAEVFALAILTTDLVPKTCSTTVDLSQGQIRITGISKGSGMIHPNMATMLGYLMTDAQIPEAVAQDLLKNAADESFNMISVDGDTSTNDCVFLLANGASGVSLVTDQDHHLFRTALTEVSKTLAQAIARDGEGATKLIEVEIKGAADLSLARKAARGVTVSPLFKSAIHGEDPNWGRILARLGAEGLPSQQLEKMSLRIQDRLIFEHGRPLAFDRAELRGLLKSENVKIEIDLLSGPFQTTAWGCDLSKRYVEINTEYS